MLFWAQELNTHLNNQMMTCLAIMQTLKNQSHGFENIEWPTQGGRQDEPEQTKQKPKKTKQCSLYISLSLQCYRKVQSNILFTEKWTKSLVWSNWCLKVWWRVSGLLSETGGVFYLDLKKEGQAGSDSSCEKREERCTEANNRRLWLLLQFQHQLEDTLFKKLIHVFYVILCKMTDFPIFLHQLPSGMSITNQPAH